MFCGFTVTGKTKPYTTEKNNSLTLSRYLLSNKQDPDGKRNSQCDTRGGVNKHNRVVRLQRQWSKRMIIIEKL